jgi:hypothetical protein
MQMSASRCWPSQVSAGPGLHLPGLGVEEDLLVLVVLGLEREVFGLAPVAADGLLIPAMAASRAL